MKKAFLSAAVALAFAAGSALAADMPVKARPQAPLVQNWTGFYVGANVGYAWGRSDAVTTTDCGTFVPFFFNCGNLAVVQASGTGSLSANGITGGIQAGHNWQVDRLVYGAEVDFGAFDLKGSRAGTGAYLAVVPGVPFTTTSSIETDWLLTARGRIGWTPSPRVLAYATGGLALTNIKVANSFSEARDEDELPGSGAGINSKTKAGWTIGGGIEWMLANNWTVKAEYLYVDFPGVTSSLTVACQGDVCAGANSLLTTSSDLTAKFARLGLNYKF